MPINLLLLSKAIESLKVGLAWSTHDDLARDGVIQRFKYTFELSWKTAKKLLKAYGIDAESPRDTIRAMAQQGWLPNAETWMIFLEARNKTSHIYKEEIAKEVFEQAKLFFPQAEDLLKTLLNKNV